MNVALTPHIPMNTSPPEGGRTAPAASIVAGTHPTPVGGSHETFTAKDRDRESCSKQTPAATTVGNYPAPYDSPALRKLYYLVPGTSGEIIPAEYYRRGTIIDIRV